MALNDTVIKAAKPREKNWKLTDEKGLYLLVTPAVGKLWRVKFRHHGKEKKLALGAYPDVGLAKARKLRDAAREKLADGHDPALDRKRARFAAKLSSGVTFASVAREYIDSKMVGDGRAETTVSKARWFLDQLDPAIGTMPLADVDPQMLLAALKRLEAKGPSRDRKEMPVIRKPSVSLRRCHWPLQNGPGSVALRCSDHAKGEALCGHSGAGQAGSASACYRCILRVAGHDSGVADRSSRFCPARRASPCRVA